MDKTTARYDKLEKLRFFSTWEIPSQKKILAICLGVYTVGCVHSLKIKIFRYVAMNRHIQSLHFTTKIRKIRSIWSCFSNYGDNTVVSQLHNLLCYHPSSQPRLFPFFVLCTCSLNLLNVSSITHMCGIYVLGVPNDRSNKCEQWKINRRFFEIEDLGASGIHGCRNFDRWRVGVVHQPKKWVNSLTLFPVKISIKYFH